MKKIICTIAMIVMVLTLSACGGGNIDHVEILEWEPSEIYTDSDIESAMQTAMDYFSKEFDGCTLLTIEYDEEAFVNQFAEWAEWNNADEAIIILSSFYVDSTGIDNGFTPNMTYAGWNWILVRNEGENWRHVDHGYG